MARPTVMSDSYGLERRRRLTSGIPNNMHNRHELSISARMVTVGTQFARSESCHKSPRAAFARSAFDAAVAICGVGSNELVRVAAEVDAGLAVQIEEDEFVVFRC
jgi:hypothetical protein